MHLVDQSNFGKEIEHLLMILHLVKIGKIRQRRKNPKY